MTQKSDIGSKRLISLSPNPWVRWLTGQTDVSVVEFLSSEFQWVNRSNDVLLKVHSPQQGDFLLLNEIQLRYSDRMPRRIRAYAALAEERYNLPVYPVLINILPNRKKAIVPTYYQSDFMGIQAYQDYHVVNLSEVEAELVFRERISTLLPFVPILKGGGEEKIVRTALRQLRADEQLQDLEPLLSFFASFVLEIPIVQEIMRWDMTVLRESPWYQEILTEGLQQGMQQGIQQGMQQGIQQGVQQGMQQGMQQGEASLIIRLLSKRFGTLSFDIVDRIEALPIARLDDLGENLFDFTTLNDVRTWLSQE